MIRIYADLNCPFCYALSEWIDEADLNAMIDWRLIEHNPAASFQSHADQALIELTEEIFIIRQRASDIQIQLPQGRTNVRKAEKFLTQVKLSHPELFIPLKQLVYRAYWAEDGNIEDDRLLQQLLDKVGLNSLEITSQSDEQINEWTTGWDNGPFERTLPVIQRSEFDFSLGLCTRADTLNYLLGQSNSTSATSNSCHYQSRPQVVMLGNWSSFWKLTKIMRDQIDVIYLPDINALTERFNSSNPPDLVMLDFAEVDSRSKRALKQYNQLCSHHQCPLMAIIKSLDEEQELELLSSGCSEVISQKSEHYVLLKIKQLLKNKSLIDQLKANSLVDSLTQLNNRRSFIHSLEKEWARAARSREYLSLLILDIDFFKAYNDHFGHLAGDGCLRQVASIIQNQIKRSGDTAYRYGGEEFMIILPNTDEKGAKNKAEEIRSRISQSQLEHPECEHKHVTVSIGVYSSYHRKDVSVNDLIELADQQLYRAKSSGRNTYKSAAAG